MLTKLQKIALIAVPALMTVGFTQIPTKQAPTSFQIAAATPRVGETAPDFTAIDSNGKSHSLSDFKGKIVVLEWTNNQCPFVRKQYEPGNMQKLQKAAKDKGVVWLSIISSAPGKQGYVNAQEANTLTKNRNAVPTAVLLDADGKIGRLYDARTTPHMYIIANNKLAYMGAIDSISSSDTGDIPKAKNYVTTALNELLSNKPVSTPVTQPYGCSVKYNK